MSTPAYEKLGAFYLGRLFDLDADDVTDEPLLYDAKDLTTHAICVGMTGSGKTGLCVTLLEEAAIDGIPAILIDPKGDLGNMLLAFPELRPDDFRPWVDESEAERKGLSPDEYAANRAELWRKGLGKWGQDGSRIARFRDAADVSIYTPGSNAGLPLSVLQSFAAPPPELVADADAFRERTSATVSGLLALLGIDADPIRSREHILLSNILDRAWRDGRTLDIATLIGEIQNPPFERIGVMDLEAVFPGKDRLDLAMSLNNLLASPGFQAWLEGDPLDIPKLLYTSEGKPRLSIISIAHLSDAERMFIVTLVLNELLAWVRLQSGTSSLRALLYMDEVFGFFPPVANPPSKQPLLTLMKQARAFGVGVVLATQNPADLDYKGISNAGTWFLGRLQTERDKMRVLEGLEGASASSGAKFDRKTMDAALAGLGSRVFIMNNVHDDGPAAFHTRWALSYLRGPLTRTQIQKLMADRKATATAAAAAAAPHVAQPSKTVAAASRAEKTLPATPGPIPPGIEQRFLPVARGDDTRIVYRPGLVGLGQMHYVRLGAKVDFWKDIAFLCRLDDEAPADPWEEADQLEEARPDLVREADVPGEFMTLPVYATRKTSYSKWSRAFKDHVYRNRPLILRHAKKYKLYSEPEETEGDFRVRLRHIVHEERDEKIEKLKDRYQPKFTSLRDRIRKGEQRIETEKAQFRKSGFDTAISAGATLLGALFGRKKASVGNVGRAATTARGVGRTAQQKGDIAHAEANVQSLRDQLVALEAEFEEDVEEVRKDTDVDAMELDEITVRPRKNDMNVRLVSLVWMPYTVDDAGLAEPAFEV